MDGYLLNIKNNSSDTQEIELFNSSDQDGTVEPVTWQFQCDEMFGYGANPVFNIATGLFFDQTISANNGQVKISFEAPDGGVSASGGLGADETMDNLVDTMNEVGFLGPMSDVGVWSMRGPFATAADPLGQQTFEIKCVVDPDFFRSSISQVAPNLGAVKLVLQGTGFTTYEVLASSQPNNFFRSLPSNSSVAIKTFGNFNYNQFLYSVTQRNYDVKQFEIFSTNKNQLLEPFVFDRKLATGKVYQKVLTPTIDPYQSNNYLRTDDRKGYVIDGFTKLKYKVLPSASVRLVMRYNYIDLATPLIVKKTKETEEFYNQAGQYNPAVLTPLNSTFTNRIDTGYDSMGCNYLNSRLAIQEDKLNDLETAGTNPRWQAFLRERIQYIKDKLQSENCEVTQEVPQFSTIGDEYKPRDLFIPTNEFIQHQIDTEQGAKKLLEDTDFPIDQGEVA